jgi:membrane protein YdbS with pleckstrin-like domain
MASLSDPVSTALLATALVAVAIRIATHGQPRWRLIGAVAMLVILVSLVALVVVAMDRAHVFDWEELGHPPQPSG